MNHIGMKFDDLEKSICYSFVLQHPKNRIVVPVTVPDLYLVRKYECSGSTVHDMTDMPALEGDKEPKYKTVKELKLIGKSWKDLVEYCSSDNLNYTNQGVVIINTNINGRTKLRCKNYEKVKHLKGNSPKMQFHYYYLRQNGLVKEFLQYYPEYKQLFRDLRSNLHDWTLQLYKNYHGCFIRKEKRFKKLSV